MSDEQKGFLWDELTLGIRPTAETSGSFEGQETTLGVCGCPGKHPTSRFAKTGQICRQQTYALNAEAEGVPYEEYVEAMETHAAMNSVLDGMEQLGELLMSLVIEAAFEAAMAGDMGPLLSLMAGDTEMGVPGLPDDDMPSWMKPLTDETDPDEEEVEDDFPWWDNDDDTETDD
jgi:hypothetical protein